MTGPELSDIEAARKRLDGVARVTPVYRSDTLSQTCGVDVHLKAENLQRTGSFKVRGAYNRISQLSDDQRAWIGSCGYSSSLRSWSCSG